jgi:hypothetical protein
VARGPISRFRNLGDRAGLSTAAGAPGIAHGPDRVRARAGASAGEAVFPYQRLERDSAVHAHLADSRRAPGQVSTIHYFSSF